jgi:FkbM family methyltransferase
MNARRRREPHIERIVGAVARHLPRGRALAAQWLERRAIGGREVSYKDLNGHRRRADLTDDMECKWFTGCALHLPESVIRHVEPRSWVVDVGANVGIVSGQLARRVGTEGLTWAFEPLPRNVARLRQLAADNDLTQLRVYDHALGDRSGVATLRVPSIGHSGWASFRAPWINGGLIDVPMVKLDDLSDDQPRRLSFMKIDVEGYEAQVLHGATQTLKRHRPTLCIEFNDLLLRGIGSSSAELLSYCGELGYQPVAPVSELALEGSIVDLLLRPNSSVAPCRAQ